MGFQSGINAMLGSVVGAGFAIQKTLQQRQEGAVKKSEDKKTATQTQKRKYKSFKTALYEHPDLKGLSEKAKKQVYEQTKHDSKFKQEVLNKYYGNK